MGWFKKRLESTLDNIIFAAIVAGGIGVWSLMSSLPGPIIFALVVVVFAGILVVLNQVRTWRENRKKKLLKISDEEIEDTIYKWVRPPHFDIHEQKIDKKTFFFQIIVTDSAKREVFISRKREQPSQLELRSSVETLVGAEKTLFTRLEQVEQEQIILRLEMELARVGIGHDNINFPLDKIVLVEIVSLDDLVGEVDFQRGANVCTESRNTMSGNYFPCMEGSVISGI